MPSQEYRKSKSRIDKDEQSNAIEQVWQVEIMHCMIMQMVKTSKVMQSHKYGKLRSCIGKDKQSNAIAQVWQVEITQGQGHSPSKEER